MITKITGVLEFECIVCKNTLLCLAFGMFLCCFYCFGVYACMCVRVPTVESTMRLTPKVVLFLFILCVHCTVLVSMYLCLPSNYTTKLFNIDSIFPALKTNHWHLFWNFHIAQIVALIIFVFFLLGFLLFDIWCEHSCNFGEHFYVYYAFWCFNLMKIAWLFGIWWFLILTGIRRIHSR